jgi:hypothetical protein
MNGDPDDFPPDVLTVLRFLSVYVQNRPVTPGLIKTAVPTIFRCVPDHLAMIEHHPRSSKGSRPRLLPFYELRVYGPRTDGRWVFRPGRLSKLLQSVMK